MDVGPSDVVETILDMTGANYDHPTSNLNSNSVSLKPVMIEILAKEVRFSVVGGQTLLVKLAPADTSVPYRLAITMWAGT